MGLDQKNIHKNKKAFFDYEILEQYEAGIKLLGSEVKSIRNGSCNLKGAFVTFHGKDAYIVGMHITGYRMAQDIIDPKRERKILLKKTTLLRLLQKSKEKGATIVPLEVYLKGPWIKIAVGLVRGKKLFDKKASIKKRDVERDVAVELAGKRNFQLD